MKNSSYIYVVPQSGTSIIDSLPNKSAYDKKIEKSPYKEECFVITVTAERRLTSLKTDEQIGEDYLDNAITAAVVAGVPLKDAFKRLEDAGKVKVEIFVPKSAPAPQAE